jgi:cyclopropane fatty-acyl-phospholipid synthase-like methyltransferase
MAAKKALFDKKGIALTRAKLRAWWDGADFDPAAAMAEIEAKLAAEPVANDVTEDELFDELFDELPYELPPRLQALGVLWGEDRVRPGDATADRLEPARIGLPPEGVLAVLGPGLAGVMAAVAAAHPGKIDVFEWREETFDALKHGLKKAKLDTRITVTRIDLEAHILPPGAYDGLLSVDDFAYCGHPPQLAGQILKSLKPGACAVVECYVGLKSPELATAFASSFAEPQIRAHGDVLQVFSDIGFTLEADEDMTEDFLFTARAAFKQLGQRLAAAGALEVPVARELAWETEAWRMRLQLLATRRLERRRFVLRRPAEDQPANANAPAG